MVVECIAHRHCGPVVERGTGADRAPVTEQWRWRQAPVVDRCADHERGW
jgi:hypothetical protein